MYDINRLGELERIPFTEFKFPAGGFEVCRLNLTFVAQIFRVGIKDG